MEKKRNYICENYIFAQSQIIEIKDIIENNKNRLFGQFVSKDKLRQHIKKLEEMHYCEKCPNKEKCLNYFNGRN